MDEHMDFPEHQDTLRWTGLLYIHHKMWFEKEESKEEKEGRKKKKNNNKQTKQKTKNKNKKQKRTILQLILYNPQSSNFDEIYKTEKEEKKEEKRQPQDAIH